MAPVMFSYSSILSLGDDRRYTKESDELLKLIRQIEAPDLDYQLYTTALENPDRGDSERQLRWASRLKLNPNARPQLVEGEGKEGKGRGAKGGKGGGKKKSDETVLSHAIHIGVHDEMLIQLIDYGADPFRRENWEALFRSRVHQANLRENDNVPTPIPALDLNSLRSLHPRTTRLLDALRDRGFGAFIVALRSEQDNLILHHTIETGDPRFVEAAVRYLILREGLEDAMILQDSHGHYPLHLAIGSNNKDIWEMLTNVNLSRLTFSERDSRGDTIVHLAVRNHNFPVLKKLATDRLADIEAAFTKANNAGQTPIELAAKDGVSLFGLLLTLFPSKLITKEAMYHAIDSGNLPIVRILDRALLLDTRPDEGADYARRAFDKGQKSVLDYFRSRNYTTSIIPTRSPSETSGSGARSGSASSQGSGSGGGSDSRATSDSGRGSRRGTDRAARVTLPTRGGAREAGSKGGTRFWV